jgi:hypothetical protein
LQTLKSAEAGERVNAHVQFIKPQSKLVWRLRHRWNTSREVMTVTQIIIHADLMNDAWRGGLHKLKARVRGVQLVIEMLF